MTITILLVILNLTLHGFFIWGRYQIMRDPEPGKTPRGVRVIEISVLIAILVTTASIAARDSADLGREACAVGVAALSLGLFLWGVRTVRRTPLTHAFSDDRPTFLLTTGPFRLTRNPFYTSYLLAYVFALVASDDWWPLVVLVWMAAIYVSAALEEERKFLGSPLRDEYLRYRERTGRFLPRPGRLQTFRHDVGVGGVITPGRAAIRPRRHAP